MVIRIVIFMSAPLLALLYSLFPLTSPVAYLTVIVCLCWTYLSVEDALHLSVPVWALYIACALTWILAIAQQKILLEFSIVFLSMVSIVALLMMIQFFKRQSLIGPADFFVIFSLGITLRPFLIGPWLLIACTIPLIGFMARGADRSAKLPFIPYLTVGWLLASIFT